MVSRQVTGGLKIQIDFHYKTQFGALANILQSVGGLLEERNLKIRIIVCPLQYRQTWENSKFNIIFIFTK